MRRLWIAAGVCLLIVAAVWRESRVNAPLALATTTSVTNSGLLDHVLPAFRDQSVRVIQVGSGRALALLADGAADVAISHAPEREREVLREHPAWFYRKILYNDFVIVGPPSDPAGIATMSDASSAMQRIRQRGERFISRGDESGTHDRERQLWKAAGVESAHPLVVVAGASMGQTLRIASETLGYTLTDRGTFEMLQGSLHLRVLVAGDSRLLNTYAVVANPDNARGLEFADWLTAGDGRRVLAETLRSGTIRGFTIWPANVDDSRPESLPFVAR